MSERDVIALLEILEDGAYKAGLEANKSARRERISSSTGLRHRQQSLIQMSGSPGTSIVLFNYWVV
jgi:hypothetical protein